MIVRFTSAYHTPSDREVVVAERGAFAAFDVGVDASRGRGSSIQRKLPAIDHEYH